MRCLRRALWVMVALFGLCGPLWAQDPILRLDLDAESGEVGQPVVLRLSVLVPTWMPQPPIFPTYETPNLIVRLPERASGPISETIDGETWSGVSRAYRLYPMIEGTFRLPAQEVQIVYADPGSSDPVAKRLVTDEVVLKASLPDAARDLDPLILAEGLSLDQKIEGGEGTLAVGDAITRTVTAKISGTSALFIPPLIAAQDDGTLRAYPKEPAVTETEDRGVLSGQRVDTATYLAQAKGAGSLPPISLSWYNLKTKAVETAELPGLDFEVTADAVNADGSPVGREVDWFAVAKMVIVLLLLCLILWLLWRFALPPARAWIAELRARHRASEKFAYRAVQRAVGARNLNQTLAAETEWSRRLPDRGSPQDADLKRAMLVVSEAEFGTHQNAVSDATGWDQVSKAVAAARRSRLAAMRAERHTDLPPLNPL